MATLMLASTISNSIQGTCFPLKVEEKKKKRKNIFPMIKHDPIGDGSNNN
jgi:hypothetical protein